MSVVSISRVAAVTRDPRRSVDVVTANDTIVRLALLVERPETEQRG